VAVGAVVVIGLGPAGTDHLLPAARAALERIPVRYARTARHPAVAELAAQGIALTALDHCYDGAATLDGAYTAIVRTLAGAAREHGEVAYAVPGNPAVAERTPGLLRAEGLDVTVVPGLSFAELAWARLGVDPMQGATLVDGRDLPRALAGASGRLLVCQVDSPLVLSDCKLALLDHLDGATEVTVLQRLGLPGEAVTRVALEDLDRAVVPDHLTALYVDTGEQVIAGELAALYAIVERLRGPGGCPWDAAQTHHSLARHCLEEAYEVVEAIERLPLDAPGGGEPIDAGDYDALRDELGDLLFQVFIHAALAAEAGAFTIADVAAGIHDKLVRRHPHVFGDVEVAGAGEVIANWEQIKKAEQGSGSVVDEVPASLPSLLYAAKLVRKAESVGLDAAGLVAEPAGAAARLAALPATTGAEAVLAVGDVLAAVAAAARAVDVDAEVALRGWATRLRDRIRAHEAATGP
jgi:tetrapyrrole methylase family protein/MazG family protein